MKTHAPRPAQRGFTIIELMVVVVITGILAAIAIPTFTGYVLKSRTTEATEFLGQLKLRQEAYRAEFGLYASQTGLTFPGYDFVPALSSLTAGTTQQFPDNADFASLGARPTGPTRFAYSFIGGPPATAPTGAPPNGLGFTSATADHWFAAQAQADLDGDGSRCTFEVTSHTRNVWYSPAKGWE